MKIVLVFTLTLQLSQAPLQNSGTFSRPPGVHAGVNDPAITLNLAFVIGFIVRR